MSEVKVDTISERTTDAGVTVEGVKIEDGIATFQTAAGSPLVFEGATANAFETTFAITDPTADRTITFPDSSFTVPTQDTAGSLVYLASSRSTVNVATVNFESFKSTDYLFYQVTGFMEPVSAGAQLDIRLMDGSTAITASDYLYRSAGSAYDGYYTQSSESNDNWTVADVVGSTQPIIFSFQLHLQDATDDDYDGAILIGNFGYVRNGGTAGAERTVYGLYPIDNASIDGIQFYHSSGDVNYHKIALYGMKGS